MRPPRSLSIIPVVLLATLSGCSLFYDPCGDLEDRVCSDLGADCGAFRGTPRIHDAIIPLRRRQAERAQCEMFAADENYASYTLPQIRYLVAAERNPATPPPRLAPPRPAGLSASTASYGWYALPFVMIPAILVYSSVMRKRMMASMGGANGVASPGAAFGAQAPVAFSPPSNGFGQVGGATANGATEGFALVTSRAAAEELARTGALVPLELVPGLSVPENLVYVTPDASARMKAIAQQVESLRQSGRTGSLVVEPEYQGESFVPKALVVRFDTIRERVPVW